MALNCTRFKTFAGTLCFSYLYAVKDTFSIQGESKGLEFLARAGRQWNFKLKSPQAGLFKSPRSPD